MAKCLYMRVECLLETKGKCGRAAKCPYATKLMTEKRVKNLEEYYTKFIREQALVAETLGEKGVKGREPEDKEAKVATTLVPR